jgi:hypothetical protein
VVYKVALGLEQFTCYGSITVICLSKSVWRRKIWWSVNNELKKIWKKAVVVYFRYYTSICLEGRRKSMKDLRIWVSNPRPVAAAVSYIYTTKITEWSRLLGMPVIIICQRAACETAVATKQMWPFAIKRLDASALGHPVWDPIFELVTSRVVASRHRFTGGRKAEGNKPLGRYWHRWKYNINPLKTERIQFYIRTQCVPRCKHSPLRL